MGSNEIRSFRQIPGVRIVALCDVDDANLGPGVEGFQKRNDTVAAYHDVRKLLDSREVEAVVVTTPNHWHALVTRLTFNPETERYIGEFSQAANQPISRQYRALFVVPEKV